MRMDNGPDPEIGTWVEVQDLDRRPLGQGTYLGHVLTTSDPETGARTAIEGGVPKHPREYLPSEREKTTPCFQLADGTIVHGYNHWWAVVVE